MPHLKSFINAIMSRPAYIDHTVLDGGHRVILAIAHTFDNTRVWWLYDGKAWILVTDEMALKYCRRYHFTYRYEEMLLKPIN